MGKMKEIDLVLRSTEEHLEAINQKLDSFLHLMKDMVSLEGKIEGLEEKIDKTLTRLTDQLIQMSMVQKGDSTAAVQYRAQTRLDNTFSSKESWEQEQEEKGDEWDSPDFDVVEMKG
jgi:hypothetical protein